MITVIAPHPKGASVDSTEQRKVVARTPLGVVKAMCEDALFTYEGYVKAVKKTMGVSYQVPVYISECLTLVPLGRVRNHGTVWFNAASLLSLVTRPGGTDILFKDGSVHRTHLSKARIERRLGLLMRIRAARVKHFHSVSCGQLPF